jgi:hypothetical protein
MRDDTVVSAMAAGRRRCLLPHSVCPMPAPAAEFLLCNTYEQVNHVIFISIWPLLIHSYCMHCHMTMVIPEVYKTRL